MAEVRQRRSLGEKIELLDLHANRANSIRIAQVRGGELPTLAEFIATLRDHTAFYERAKDSLYWLRDETIPDFHGPARIDYESETVRQISHEEYDRLRTEERALVYSGTGPLLLGVVGRGVNVERLMITAFYGPYHEARIAFVRKQTHAEAQNGLASTFASSVRPVSEA